MSVKISILLVTVLTSVFALVDGGGQPAQAEERAERAEEKAEERAERAEEIAEEAKERAEEAAERREERAEEAEERAETAQRKAGESEDRSSEGVTLKIEGDPGTEFSGACTVGDEQYEIGGQVPQSFEYDLDGQELACEIRRQGAGAGDLKIVLTGDGVRAVQQTNSEGVVRLTHDVSNTSTLVSSSGSANTVISSSSTSSP